MQLLRTPIIRIPTRPLQLHLRPQLQRRTQSTNSDPPHHDLPTFLAHAARTNLSPTSTTYVGTHYEYIVQRALARFGLSLTRTGGRLDRGIDLLGTWRLPTQTPPFSPHPLRVLVQCKALGRKAGPNLVRELEGAFAGAPARWRELNMAAAEGADADAAKSASSGTGIMALLVAPKEATAGVRDALGRSRWPMGYAKVALNGRVEQLLWNRSAADRGFQGLSVSTRYRPRRAIVGEEGGETDERLEQEVVLTWEGEVWEVGSGEDGDGSASLADLESNMVEPQRG